MTALGKYCLSLLVPLLFVMPPQQTSAEEFDANGVPIHYVDMGGDGAPVVLVHSFSSSSGMWTNAGFAPSEDLRFIAMDLRGHGDSGKPADPDQYGTEMVTDVVRLMDHLGIEQAHLAGYSMGAEIALKVATEHPGRIRSLVVGGSGWSGEPEYELYAGVGAVLQNSPDLESAMRTMMADATDEMFAFMMAALQAHGIRTEGQDAAALANAVLSMNAIVDLTDEQLAALPMPVLGVAGENDPERPTIEKLADVVPDFTMVVIPGTDHLDAILDPLFRDSIVDFFSER